MRKLAEPDYSALRAIDPKTGAIKWEHKFATASLAGVMSTASGVVFAGDHEGFFNAFESRRARGCGPIEPDRRSGARRR